MPIHPPFGDLSPDDFLERHWQKQPLLIRNAIAGFEPVPTAEQLASLATDPDVESRLVLQRDGPPGWDVRHGPFDEATFASLPESRWTLLVQEVDRWVEDTADLLERFRFIPNWRIDDVMVSYAAPGGGVGAHVDRYDVFLLQALGRRRWSIGRQPVEHERLVPELELRVLETFSPDEEWVLEPGDMLYLPPRLPHWGVALDPCMTFSIGFRAPGHQELVGTFLSRALESLAPDARYTDPDLKATREPGEISPAAVGQFRSVLREFVEDDDHFGGWLGSFLTEPKRLREEPEGPPPTSCEVASDLREGAVLRRVTPPRFAFLQDRGVDRLFVGGEELDLPRNTAGLAALLCGTDPLDAATLGSHLDTPGVGDLIARLLESGYLVRSERSIL